MDEPTTRRTFLRSAASGALITASQPAFPWLPREKRLGFAVVGLGSLAVNQILPALQKTEHCHLAGAVTGTPAKGKAFSGTYGIDPKHVYTYEAFDKIVDDDSIDVIVIALPNSLHKEFSIRAAKAGKHVLCEKPMAMNVAECEAMIAASKEAERQLAIGYRCQFEPHNLECMRLLRKREFGKPMMIETGCGFRGAPNPKMWRLQKALSGGGALIDVGLYALQATRYLLDEEPIEVTAIETKTDPVTFKEVDETMVWSMRFPSGVVANGTASYNMGGYDRFWVGCERGWIRLENAFAYTGQEGERHDKQKISFEHTDQFAVQMDEFAQCIQQKRPTTVSGEEGLRDMRVIEAIYRAARTGRKIAVS